MAGTKVMNVDGIIAQVGELAGTIWALKESDDLNANLLRFPTGRGVAEHVNDEVDVLLLGVSGSGVVAIEGDEQALSSGTLLFVPKSVRRSIWSASEDFAYLSIHRRRGGLRIGRRERRVEERDDKGHASR